MQRVDILRRQLNALATATMPELKIKFADLYGFDCGQTNVHNLRKRIAYKIQEIHYGGLTEADRAKIDELADSDPMANMVRTSNVPRKITKGTRFQRDWKGKTYEVIVLEDGQYEFDGIRYRSLSAIADKITGTHWNGKKFFGVK